MNKDIKEQWVAALRSGEYKQGQGGLHIRSDGEDLYCCLGVLCELAVKAGVDIDVEAFEDPDAFATDPYTHFEYAGLSGMPPEEVLTWANLAVRTPLRTPLAEGAWPLPTLNDGRGGAWNTSSSVTRHTFAQIADIIEEQL